MSDDETGYAEGWKPEPGNAVKGVVTDIAATDNGWGPYPVLTLKREDGSEIAVHAFHDVLRKELARRRPGVGADLEITYLGLKKPKGGSGNGYHAYRVRSSTDAVGYDWDSELPGEQRRNDEPPIPPAPIPQTNPAAAQFVSNSGPTVQERAAESYGDAPPFLWEGVPTYEQVKGHASRW